ncbi:MAG: hypothetical protein QN130_14535, partial [Armatimonadota bacterium]|nr:hypothetical protein [Armatimonadota bacterium]
MGTLVIVERQVAIQSVLHGRHAGEEASAELQAPQLAQDGALQALDEAVGPGMAGLGPRVLDPQRPTGLIERPPGTRCPDRS